MSLHVSALGASLDRKNVLCTEASVLWKIKFCIGDLHIGFPWVPCQRELDPECVFCVASNFAEVSFDSWHCRLSHQSAIILWLNLGIMIGMWFCFLTCSEKSDLASRPVFSQFNICHLWKHSRTSTVSLFIPQSVKKKKAALKISSVFHFLVGWDHFKELLDISLVHWRKVQLLPWPVRLS